MCTLCNQVIHCSTSLGQKPSLSFKLLKVGWSQLPCTVPSLCYSAQALPISTQPLLLCCNFPALSKEDGAREVIHETLAAKTYDLAPFPRTPMMEGEEKKLQEIVLWLPYVCHSIYTYQPAPDTHTHTEKKKPEEREWNAFIWNKHCNYLLKDSILKKNSLIYKTSLHGYNSISSASIQLVSFITCDSNCSRKPGWFSWWSLCYRLHCLNCMSCAHTFALVF